MSPVSEAMCRVDESEQLHALQSAEDMLVDEISRPILVQMVNRATAENATLKTTSMVDRLLVHHRKILADARKKESLIERDERHELQSVQADIEAAERIYFNALADCDVRRGEIKGSFAQRRRDNKAILAGSAAALAAIETSR